MERQLSRRMEMTGMNELERQHSKQSLSQPSLHSSSSPYGSTASLRSFPSTLSLSNTQTKNTQLSLSNHSTNTHTTTSSTSSSSSSSSLVHPLLQRRYRSVLLLVIYTLTLCCVWFSYQLSQSIVKELLGGRTSPKSMMANFAPQIIKKKNQQQQQQNSLSMEEPADEPDPESPTEKEAVQQQGLNERLAPHVQLSTMTNDNASSWNENNSALETNPDSNHDPNNTRLNHPNELENHLDTDVLCSGCRFGFLDPNNAAGGTCFALILRELASTLTATTSNDHDAPLVAAARTIASRHPMVCGACDPDSCSAGSKVYKRVDEVAPRILEAKSHYLRNVPKTMRLPKEVVRLNGSIDATFFDDPAHTYPNRTYFFEFNPSITKLPASQIPPYMREDERYQLQGRRPSYVAVYRVSYHHNCFTDRDAYFKMMGSQWPAPADKSYLAIAILSDTLDILDSTIIVPRKKYQDPRVFQLNGKLFFGSYQYLHQFWIVTPPEMFGDSTTTVSNMDDKQLKQIGLYRPDRITKGKHQLDLYLRSFTICTNEKNVFTYGKNLNYFVVPNGTQNGINNVVLEHEPMGGKEYIQLDKPCDSKQKSKKKANNNNTLLIPNSSDRTDLPSPTFSTADELYFAKLNVDTYPYTTERGGACCVPIQHPLTNETLLLGLAHVKTKYKFRKDKVKKQLASVSSSSSDRALLLQGNNSNTSEAAPMISANHFFSVFYAMEAKAPFRTIARSGRFCFGAPSETELAHSKNPFKTLGKSPLRVGPHIYNCPRIHFVSGMVEKVDDTNKLIVSYGVNDCFSRFVTIHKADTVAMLFPDSATRVPVPVDDQVVVVESNNNDKSRNNERVGETSSHLSWLCPGCRYEFVNPDGAASTTCYKSILKRMKKQGDSLIQAALAVAQEIPSCAACDPSSCSSEVKEYKRVDQLAPAILRAKTHYLNILPQQYRLPQIAVAGSDAAAVVVNQAKFFQQSKNVYSTKKYFFEFNPSITTLPADQIPLEMRNQSHYNEPGHRPSYVAVYRVSYHHNCIAGDNYFRMMGGKWPVPGDVSYLAIAVLSDTLDILKSTIIRLATKYQDPRVFNLKGQLYVVSYHLIHPIWLVVPPEMEALKEDKKNGLFQPSRVSKTTDFLDVWFRAYPSCSIDKIIRVYGKNLNLFVSAAADKDQDPKKQSVVLEFTPMEGKEYVDLTQKCGNNDQEYEIARDHASTDQFVTNSTSRVGLPAPTFSTSDELLMSRNRIDAAVYTKERGGACCVPIQHPVTNAPLLLGIAHVKTKYKFKQEKPSSALSMERNGDSNNSTFNRDKVNNQANHFFGVFYAMEAHAPFRTVARTGRFCFGFPSEEELVDSKTPYAMLGTSYLTVGAETYNCPRIHFVSGMVEQVDDASKLIISYGVNDCFSRFITIEKASAVEMLFPSHIPLNATNE